MSRPLTVGTAGHIDHGKTWLVRALTGKDTDRLPEERRRGISIDLGYAPLELPGGRTVSLVDVPGHERFVRTMVAGATGIDLFLLVIDAAEGARPQTHEHLAILRLLGVERGVVAITKVDAVDGDTVELAVEEARELVPGAPVVAVSARTGEGLDELRRALADAAREAAERPASEAVRLFVDRSFTLRGIGTVVTGTLWSGSVGEGDELRLEPAGRPVRVRSVQVHDRPVERAAAVQRVAASLPGIERTEIRRGDVLVTPGAFAPSYRLDVALDELKEIAPGARLNVHHGTAEVHARVARAGASFAQLRLAAPLVAARGDRVVMRAHTTVGGGRVLDPRPPRRLEPERLAVLARGDPAEIARALVRAPVTRETLAARGVLAPDEVDTALGGLSRAGEWYFAPDWLDDVRADARRRLGERARSTPLDPGLSLPELLPGAPWAAAIVPLLELELRNGKAYLPGAKAPDAGADAVELERRLADAGLDALRVEDRRLGTFLEQRGRLVRLGDGLAVGPAAYERARETLIAECERAGSIRLARFRDLLGASRRTAQLLLERFDADGVTRRVGDERVLRRAARDRRPA